MKPRTDSSFSGLRLAQWSWIALAATSLALPASAGESWPMFRGDAALTGVATEALPDQLVPLWIAEIPQGIESSAAVERGTVYVGGLDRKLHAIALDDGKPRWTYEASDEIRSSPSVHDGVVYFGDAAGLFHAVDAQTGKRRWTFKTEAEIVSSANFLGDALFFGSHDENLYSLATKDGALRWKVETAGYVYGTPAVVGGNVISAGCDGILRVVRAADGVLLNTIELGSYIGASPAVRGRRAFMGTFENQVVAIDLEEKRIVWRYEHATRKFPFMSSAAVTDRLLVVGGRDKLVHALDIADGSGLWTYNAGAKVDGSPVIAGDRVYFGAQNGKIVALELKTGELRWSFETGSEVYGSASIAAGRLIIGTIDGKLYCFGGPRAPDQGADDD